MRVNSHEIANSAPVVLGRNAPPSAFPKMPPGGSSTAPSPWDSDPNCGDPAADDSEGADPEQQELNGVAASAGVDRATVDWIPT